MPEKSKKETFFKASELVLISSGILFWVSIFLIWSMESFTLWFATLVLYSVGTILFIFNR